MAQALNIDIKTSKVVTAAYEQPIESIHQREDPAVVEQTMNRLVDRMENWDKRKKESKCQQEFTSLQSCRRNYTRWSWSASYRS